MWIYLAPTRLPFSSGFVHYNHLRLPCRGACKRDGLVVMIDRRKDSGRRAGDELDNLTEEIRRLRFELAESQMAVRKLLDREGLCSLCHVRLDQIRSIRQPDPFRS